MQIERLIRERIYLAKRRNQYKTMRRSTVHTLSNRKLFGIICIILGVVLILSRCTKGNTHKSRDQEKVVINEEVTAQESYYTYLQDFNIDENTLTQFYNLSLKYKKPFADTLAIGLVESYKGTKQNQILKLIKSPQSINLLSKEGGLYKEMSQIYSQFIYDIACFPLAQKNSYTFENGWKQARNYQGARKHYGIDIMDPKNQPGQLKIFSITDGTIENIGWNELGGYRVGVRSNGGAYFYYAHLNQNPTHIQKGDTLFAGDYLGDMGDTGYGEEGTRGEFPVHLHVGIAVKTKDNEEFWLNPYYLLKYLELKDFTYRTL